MSESFVIRRRHPDRPLIEPDGECVLCGGTVPEWKVRYHLNNGETVFCFQCERETPDRAYCFGLKDAAVAQYIFGQKLRSAKVVLWQLETEIDRQKHG